MANEEFVRISVNHRVPTFSVRGCEKKLQYFGIRTPGLWNKLGKIRWQSAGGGAHLLVPGVQEHLEAKYDAKGFEHRDARFRIPSIYLDEVLPFFYPLDYIEKKPRREWNEEMVVGELIRGEIPPALSRKGGVEFEYRGYNIQPEREGGYDGSRHGMPTRSLNHFFHAVIEEWVYEELVCAQGHSVCFFAPEEVALTEGGRRRANLPIPKAIDAAVRTEPEQIADNLYIPEELRVASNQPLLRLWA